MNSEGPTIIVGAWKVVGWDRKFFLRPAEIASFGVGPRFHLFLSCVYQGNEKGGVSSGYPYVTPGVERFFLDFLWAIESYMKCALAVGCGVCDCLVSVWNLILWTENLNSGDQKILLVVITLVLMKVDNEEIS